ncbi:MAG TPA: heme-binding protein, partial [Rhodoferax sp.]|nr:heme-binding protein [Rhodoferax sp.]
MDYFPSPPSARSVGQRLIDVLAASDAVRSSVAYATALGTAVNVAVVDVSGALVAFLRMPGA